MRTNVAEQTVPSASTHTPKYLTLPTGSSAEVYAHTFQYLKLSVPTHSLLDFLSFYFIFYFFFPFVYTVFCDNWNLTNPKSLAPPLLSYH